MHQRRSMKSCSRNRSRSLQRNTIDLWLQREAPIIQPQIDSASISLARKRLQSEAWEISIFNLQARRSLLFNPSNLEDPMFIKFKTSHNKLSRRSRSPKVRAVSQERKEAIANRELATDWWIRSKRPIARRWKCQILFYHYRWNKSILSQNLLILRKRSLVKERNMLQTSLKTMEKYLLRCRH